MNLHQAILKTSNPMTFEKLAPARKMASKYNNETPNKKAITIDR